MEIRSYDHRGSALAHLSSPHVRYQRDTTNLWGWGGSPHLSISKNWQGAEVSLGDFFNSLTPLRAKRDWWTGYYEWVNTTRLKFDDALTLLCANIQLNMQIFFLSHFVDELSSVCYIKILPAITNQPVSQGGYKLDLIHSCPHKLTQCINTV